MAEPMVNVEIPRDLHAELRREADFEESLVEVIRRLLRERSGDAESDQDAAGGSGYLAGLIRAGKLHPGQTVTYELKRKGQAFMATVTAGGSLELSDGRIFKSPSGAANACSGTSNNGWAKWRTADGSSLDELRSELAGE
ncbi:DUF4357 domain-containing protein [Glycomyces sp. NPDC047369]